MNLRTCLKLLLNFSVCMQTRQGRKTPDTVLMGVYITLTIS